MTTQEDVVRALIDAIEQMRALGATPSSMEIEQELYDALRVAVPTPYPAPGAVPMFNGVRFTVKPRMPTGK